MVTPLFFQIAFYQGESAGAQAINTGRDDLGKIDKRVSAALRQFSHSDPPHDTYELEGLKHLFFYFRLERSLGRMVESQKEQLFRFEAQSELLEFGTTIGTIEALQAPKLF